MFARSGCKNGLALTLLFLLTWSVHAGPGEDYEAGLKSYRDGDVVGAMAPLKKAADAGHTKGMVLYAEVLNRAEFSDEALKLYKRAAELGDPDGMLGYAAMLASGEGTGSGKKKEANPAEARVWVEKAAELGHEHSIKTLAQSYIRNELGLTNADRVSPQGLKWIEQAAKLDFLPAVDILEQAYRTGGILAVPVDLRLAEQFRVQASRLRGLDPKKMKKRTRKQIAAEAAAMEGK